MTERELSHLLSMATESSRDAIVVASAQGVGGQGRQILYANAAFERMTGYSVAEVLGKTLKILQGPLTDRSVVDRLRANLAAGVPVRETLLNYKKDGSTFWAELDITPVVGEAGVVTHWISIQREVTDRIERERTLAQIAEHVPGVIYTYRLFPDGRSCFPFASRAIERLYGVSPEQVERDASPVFDRLHPDDLQMVVASIKKSAETLSPWNIAYRTVLPNGQITRVYGNATPERLDDGSILWHGYIYDVELNIEVVDQELKAILDAIPAAVFMKDTGSRIILMNTAAEEQWGISLLDVMGTDGSKYVPAEIMSQYLAEDQTVLSHLGTSSTRATVWNAKLQQNRSVHTFKRAIRDQSDNPKYIVGVTFDVTEIEETERTLRASEEKLRGLFELSPLGFAMSNSEDRYVEFNAAFANICGYTLEEVSGLGNWKLTPPEYRDSDLEMLSRVRRHRRYGPYEKEYIRKDGTRIPVQLNGTIITGSDGKNYIWSVVEDITTRKNEQKNAARLAAIVESTDDAIIGKDLNGMINYWNAAAARMFGYNSDEVVGRHISLLYPFERRSDEEFIRTSILRGERVKNYQTIRLRKDGSRFPASVTVSPVFDADGVVVSASKIVRDITAQKQIEREQARFQSIVEQSSDAILSIDSRGLITTWNPAAERIFGYSADEAIGQSIKIVIPPEAEDSVSDLTLRGGKLPQTRVLRMNKKGEKFHVEVSTAALYDETGAVIGASGVLRDIRDRERIEEQLRQSQKMEAIGNLTGGLAHDFNNLLGVIMGNMEILRSVPTISIDDQELVTDALAAAERGGELTRQLLAFARKQPLKVSTFRVATLVNDTVKLLTRLLGENIDIVVEHEPGVCAVTADPIQLSTALTNLATNARDAMPNGGRLLIQTQFQRVEDNNQLLNFEIPPGNYAVIVVTDSGVGIAAETLPRIFEPFFTTKSRDEGTGLGLAMVFGFMKQSGGHVNVYSEPGKGTTLRLYLPCEVENKETPSNAGTGPRPGNGQIILVVEDNLSLRRVVKRQLQRLSYAILEAGTGAEALEILESSKVDLVFTDIVMPGGTDGYELGRMVRSRWPATKVLLTSGFPERRNRDRGDESLFRLITKPYRENDLARAIAEVLAST